MLLAKAIGTASPIIICQMDYFLVISFDIPYNGKVGSESISPCQGVEYTGTWLTSLLVRLKEYCIYCPSCCTTCHSFSSRGMTISIDFKDERNGFVNIDNLE